MPETERNFPAFPSGPKPFLQAFSVFRSKSDSFKEPAFYQKAHQKGGGIDDQLQQRHIFIIEINTVANRYWTCDRDPDFPRELYDSHIIKTDLKEVILCQPIVLFLIIGKQDELEKIGQMINQQYHLVQAIMTSATSLEIMSCEASKGKALKKNFINEQIYAIGDSPSDFDMIEYSEYFYNVGQFENPSKAIYKTNILEALKDICNKVKETME